jgi:hypothetical protein
MNNRRRIAIVCILLILLGLLFYYNKNQNFSTNGYSIGFSLGNDSAREKVLKKFSEIDSSLRIINSDSIRIKSDSIIESLDKVKKALSNEN